MHACIYVLCPSEKHSKRSHATPPSKKGSERAAFFSPLPFPFLVSGLNAREINRHGAKRGTSQPQQPGAAEKAGRLARTVRMTSGWAFVPFSASSISGFYRSCAHEAIYCTVHTNGRGKHGSFSRVWLSGRVASSFFLITRTSFRNARTRRHPKRNKNDKTTPLAAFLKR